MSTRVRRAISDLTRSRATGHASNGLLRYHRVAKIQLPQLPATLEQKRDFYTITAQHVSTLSHIFQQDGDSYRLRPVEAFIRVLSHHMKHFCADSCTRFRRLRTTPFVHANPGRANQPYIELGASPGTGTSEVFPRRIGAVDSSPFQLRKVTCSYCDSGRFP